MAQAGDPVALPSSIMKGDTCGSGLGNEVCEGSSGILLVQSGIFLPFPGRAADSGSGRLQSSHNELPRASPGPAERAHFSPPPPIVTGLRAPFPTAGAFGRRASLSLTCTLCFILGPQHGSKCAFRDF